MKTTIPLMFEFLPDGRVRAFDDAGSFEAVRPTMEQAAIAAEASALRLQAKRHKEEAARLQRSADELEGRYAKVDPQLPRYVKVEPSADPLPVTAPIVLPAEAVEHIKELSEAPADPKPALVEAFREVASNADELRHEPPSSFQVEVEKLRRRYIVLTPILGESKTRAWDRATHKLGSTRGIKTDEGRERWLKNAREIVAQVEAGSPS